ncbi:VOC family protein [Phenylobacterium sp.]|uniref:VOC family protein n=1 Tax=Phenylobacterium sp. TaxID=1871053 RepID=UPI0025D95D84|nr:VOC family protein [Phenylobacterium sp.]MBX3485508.1 VOC family protein [Phenylobacterium sp.]MCW5759123.1 VOC family protein [Phenylobacterium sp.]
MLGYATIGANDLEKSAKFYDAVFAPLGGKRAFANERMQFYMGGATSGMIAICKPYDDKPATAGNGSMFGLSAQDHAQVDAVHAAAIAAGAVDEGAPGMRTDTFYGAYFRDPDGNKICVFKMG